MAKSKPHKAEDPNESAADPKQPPFLVVGIGASAGGIQALKAFFEQVSADSGAAYVVILHLSPEYESQLAAVLQPAAKVPVTQVTQRVTVEPDHIYVVPPDQHLEMVEGDITVSPNLQVEDRRAPVDIFFRTLAESHRERSVAVILSGTGANGSVGIKRVKERGGATFVQAPHEAEFGDMPRNAVATGLIDEVLPVARIPAKIAAYGATLGLAELPGESQVPTDDEPQALRDIFTHLRERTGHDFSNYKRGTVSRRIARRMAVRQVPDLPAYLTFLQGNKEETQALLKDLLISVTNFFRDPKAFETLEQTVLPRILANKTPEEQVRVWVAGCATGEEAYSLAMLFAERTFEVLDAPKVQIFATDIDEAAVSTAREGIYTLNDVADVSPERLRRFFTKEGDRYRVRRELREMILFAVHNVIGDPPFSRLDLVTCRNLLIYLNQTAQDRVLKTWHFALKPGSYLLLGMSESVDSASDLFATVDNDARIYQSREVGLRPYPGPEATPFLRPPSPRRPSGEAEQVEVRPSGRISYSDLHWHLLELYAPPSLVVNEEYDIVHLSERAGRYLQVVGGEPSKNLLDLIRPELRLELRTALYQAVQQQASVEVKNLHVSVGNLPETINLQVLPVVREHDAARRFVLVLFEPSSDVAREPVAVPPEPLARHLEEELSRTKAQLRSALEQYETHAEELKASNEELRAMNEELRSAAGELETSKKELQSLNEELTTVNQELEVKIEEASLVSNDLKNLVNSTGIATIFLDRSFRISLLTPAARDLFHVIPDDVGRPITDITSRLAHQDLLADVEMVLEKRQPLEREVSTVDARRYLMRLLPYRTQEDRIDGVVMTFFDITERSRTEEALRKSEEKYRALFESMDEAYAVVEVLTDEAGRPNDFRFLEVNPAFVQHTGMPDPVGRKATEILGTPNPRWTQIYNQVAKTGQPVRFEEREAVLERTFDLYVFRLGGEGSSRVAVLFTDITERKRHEASRELLAGISEDLNRLSDEEEIIRTAGAKLAAHLGLACHHYVDVGEESAEVTVRCFWHGPDVPSALETFPIAEFMPTNGLNSLRAGKTVIVNDVRNDLPDGTAATAALKAGAAAREMGAYVAVPHSQGGRWKACFAVADTSPRRWTSAEVELIREVANRVFPRIERARAEKALRTSQQRLSLLIESATDYAIFTLDLDNRIESWNVGAQRLFGWSESEVLGRSAAIIFTPEDRDAGIPEQEIRVALERGRAPDERVHLRKDGTRFFVSGVLMLLRDASGEPQGFAKIARDVSARVRVEEEREQLLARLNELNESLEHQVDERTRELLQSQQRFKQAFEVGPVAAVMSSLEEDRVLEVNETFSKLTGYQKEECLGRTAKELGLWSDRSDQEKLRAALKDDSSGFRELELQVRTKDGRLRDILSSGQMIQLGGSAGWLKMFIDITERKRTQEELVQAIEQVMRDASWFSRSVVERVSAVRKGSVSAEAAAELTPREKQVIERIAGGMNDPQIAKELGLSRQTIRNYVTNIYSKIGVHSRAEAVVWARERGIIG